MYYLFLVLTVILGGGTVMILILQMRILSFGEVSEDFPAGTVVKNPPANAGDVGSSPGLGRSHMPQSS